MASEVMTARLLERAKTSGRADDNIEAIKKRFKTYQEKSVPVLEYFKKDNRAFEIDAGRDVETVFADAVKACATVFN